MTRRTGNAVLQANASWEERAIEACRDDPMVLNGTLCVICMCSLPNCLCAEAAERHHIPREEYRGEAAAVLGDSERDTLPVPPHPLSYDSSKWTGRK